MIQFCHSAMNAIARHWLTGTELTGKVLTPMGQRNMHALTSSSSPKISLQVSESRPISPLMFGNADV